LNVITASVTSYFSEQSLIACYHFRMKNAHF